MAKVQDYLFDLNSSQCQCGKRKKPKKSLCPNCYFRLPPGMRDDLYKRLMDGYMEAYDAAVAFLDNKPKLA